MAYRIPLIAVIFSFPVVALIITLPYILHQYHKYGSVNPLRTLIIYSFILYMMAIYFLVILPLPKLNEVTKPEVYMRLVPFSFVEDFLRESSLKLGDPSTYLKAIKEPCFYVVFFNILMTIPFGIYLKYYFKKDFKSTVISTFLLSLFFELTQLSGLYFIYKYPYRLFDIDDLLLNTLGGIIGYALAGIVSKLLPTRDEIDEHSKRAGTHVSGLRRMMVFFLDSLIFTVLFRLSKIITTYDVHLFLFVIYFGIIPFLLEGKTLGSDFLNVTFTYQKFKVMLGPLRFAFIYFYYIKMPSIVYFLSSIMPSNAFTILIKFTILLGVLIFYIWNVVHLLTKKEMFYDRLFKMQVESTIKE